VARATARAVGAGAAAAAAFLTSPATFLHASQVAVRLGQLRTDYSTSATPTLWHQAVREVGWEHRLAAPELGLPFVVLALAGLVWLLSRRESALRLLPWLVYGALSLALFSRYPFQPFRNLLPLVPLLCVAVALLVALPGRRLGWPRWTGDAAVLAVAIGLLAPPSLAFARAQSRLVDSRREAVDWLASRRGSGRVVVLRDLAILPSELRRLARPSEVGDWRALEAAVERPRVRWLVVGGAEQIPAAARARLERRFRQRTSFGERTTPADPGWWRGNRQTIRVLERRPQPAAPPQGT
jgi:hypothetical protein